MTKPRILLVTEKQERASLLEQALMQVHYPVTAKVNVDDDFVMYVQQARPDALIMDLTQLTPQILQQLYRLDEHQPLPVVIFAERSNGQITQSAVKAGVSAYVVDGFRPDRVAPVLETALARFMELKALRAERDRAQDKLAERKNIERAKGILMRRRALAEEAAYKALRKMAMDHGRPLADVAQSIITAEETLT